MNQVGRLLRDQREAERRFAQIMEHETSPQGWSAALTFFHLSQWRRRLLHAMTALSAGRAFSAPPGNIDEFNDSELPAGRGMSLAEAAARSDAALGSLIDLWEELGERPLAWYAAKSTSEALLRNSYLHPRIHMANHLTENGDPESGDQLVEATAHELRAISAPGHVLGAALYNLAAVRLKQGRRDEAIDLLEEAGPMRPDLKAFALDDTAFEALRDPPRFRSPGE